MRNAFADELAKLGDDDHRVVLLSGDIGNRLFDPFKDRHPNRFINCGVAEASMTGLAAGLAMNGLRPITYSITPFVTTRCLEQIRTDVCYHDLPVTIVAVGAGLAYAGLGPTHHACEDIAFLRALPNMTVICPGDAWEVRAAMRAVMRQSGPAYIRMGKKGEPKVHPGPLREFQIGRAITLIEGEDVCLLATGNILAEALELGHLLNSHGVSSRVVSFHTVKPLDESCLSEVLECFRLVVTLEEHSLVGGFGSAVSEWAVDRGFGGRQLLRLGTPDRFFKESGEQAHARSRLGLSAHQMAERIFARLS